MKYLVYVLLLFLLFKFEFIVFAQEQTGEGTIVIPTDTQTDSPENQPSQATSSAAVDLSNPVLTSTQIISSSLSCVKVGNPDEGLKASVCQEATTNQPGTIGPVAPPTLQDCGTDLLGNPVQCIKPAYIYYCQGDPQWGSTCSLSSAGCGPTTMAMILSSYGDTIIPPDMDAIFRQRGWRSCGDNPSYMQSAIQTLLPEMGYEYHALGAPLNLQRAQEYLNAGYLIIGSTSGHIFVIDGVNPEAGTVSLRDPGRCEYRDGVVRSADRPWGGQSLYYSYAVKKRAN